MDALKRKMEIAAVAFFCTVTALIAAYSCATTAAANLAQQTAAAPVTEYATLAYMEVQPETEQEPELLYDVPMSDELQRYVREQAERQGVPFEIALAVIERESSYQPDAVSDTGDFGLMQINVCNHRWLYEELGITDVMDPEQNIEAGLYILGQAFQKYDDPDKALQHGRQRHESRVEQGSAQQQVQPRSPRDGAEFRAKGALNELEDSQSVSHCGHLDCRSSRGRNLRLYRRTGTCSGQLRSARLLRFRR